MTIERIIVALDGSRLAEAVLPAARSVAARLGAELLLLHVLERDAPEAVHGEPHLDAPAAALDYLERLAGRLRGEGIACDVHVHSPAVADVASALDAHARELGADLIAMCAHGRSNIRGQIVGSIAERALRRGTVPILLRTIRRAGAARFDPRDILVPLDFRHDTDAAIGAACTFAAAYGARVTLLTVPELGSPAASFLLPGASALSYELDRERAGERLSAVAARIRAELPAVRTLVLEQRPAAAILEASASLPADLVVLVTDARTGLSSWYDPPVARRLLSHPDMTLLLIKQQR